MPSPAPLSASDFLTAWTPWPPGLALVVLIALPYAVAWRAASRSGRAWSRRRALLYYGAGVGTLVYCVCGPLQVERTTRFWVAALQVGILGCVTPVGLALGDPVRLWTLGHAPQRPAPLTKALRLAGRALMFPAVSSILAIGSIMAVFFSPYFEASTRSSLVETVLVAQLVGTGLLFVLPLLTEELLPAWASPGVRALIAFADGLLDAIPGIALMSTSALVSPGFPGFTGMTLDDALMDQRTGGGVLLVVSEMIGLPLIAAVVVEWVRSDAKEAREIDSVADVDEADDAVAGLWWQSDPRFENRFGTRNDG